MKNTHHCETCEKILREANKGRDMTNTHHCETCTCGKWVPKMFNKCFYIDIDGTIIEAVWGDNEVDAKLLSFGNVFRTEEAAHKALEAITKVLREADKG